MRCHDTDAPGIVPWVASSQHKRPRIDYPTRWGYRIVGTSEEAMRAHVLALLGDVEHELVLGNRSRGGKYVSLHLSLVVRDEAQRLAIYDHLTRHDAIRFVV